MIRRLFNVRPPEEFPPRGRCASKMRPLLFAAQLLVATACATASGPVTVRPVASGSYATATATDALLVLDAKTYAARWQELVGRGDAPAVDFANEAAVFLLAGSKPTGGYAIDVRGATLAGDTLVVDAIVKSPPADAIVTQAFTSPFAVIAVDRKNVAHVRWDR